MFTDVNSSIFIQNFRTLINYLIESNKIAYENIINKVIETQKKQALCKVVIYGNKMGPTKRTC